MGYCANMVDWKLRLKPGTKQQAYQALIDLANDESAMGGSTVTTVDGEQIVVNHFSWVDGHYPDYCHTLEDIFIAWRYTPNPAVWPDTVGEPISDEGECFYLHFEGEKLGDDFSLFATLAPFLEPGSFVEFLGEDDYSWRWEVTPQGKLLELTPVVIWPTSVPNEEKAEA